jgi:hypothetical protein
MSPASASTARDTRVRVLLLLSNRAAMRWMDRAVLVVMCVVCAASLARAQDTIADAPAVPQADSASRSPDRIELSLLGGLFTGADLGETRATMLTNDVPTSNETALFTTRTSITRAAAIEGRLGVRLAGSLWVEAGMSYAEPDLSVDTASDVEGARNVTAIAPLSQFVADVGLQYRWRGRRVSPFVLGGGGYLRQLDAPRTTVETGSMFYGGGGLVVRLSTASSGWLSHLAARGDARLSWLRGGIHLNDERAPAVVLSGGVTVGF